MVGGYKLKSKWFNLYAAGFQGIDPGLINAVLGEFKLRHIRVTRTELYAYLRYCLETAQETDWNPHSTVWYDIEFLAEALLGFRGGFVLVASPDNDPKQRFAFTDMPNVTQNPPLANNILRIFYSPPTSTVSGYYYPASKAPSSNPILSHADAPQYGNWMGGRRSLLEPCILKAVSNSINRSTPERPMSVDALKDHVRERYPNSRHLWSPHSITWYEKDIADLSEVLLDLRYALIITPDNSTTGFTFSDRIRSNETGPDLRNLTRLHVNYTPHTATRNGHYYDSADSPPPLLILSHRDGAQYGDWKGGGRSCHGYETSHEAQCTQETPSAFPRRRKRDHHARKDTSLTHRR